MTHEQIQDLMLAYAAGAADAEERAMAERLLASGNVAAQGAYAEALAVVASLPLSLSPITPPKSVRDRLLLRVAGDVSNSMPRPEAPPGVSASPVPMSATPRRVSGWGTWIAGAVAACLAMALTIVFSQNLDMQARYQQLEDRLAATTELDNGIRRVVASPHVKLAKLKYENRPDGSGSGGRVIFCPQSKQFQLMLYQISPPPAGRVYELWLITQDGKKLPGGTFTVDKNGNATHYFRAPRDVPITSLAITDEPSCGADTPTGAIHLMGELQ